jgi:hypothetical protein
VRKSVSRHYDRAALHPRACPACGLQLFRECPACQAEQVAHLERCAQCGAAWQVGLQAADSLGAG